MSLSISNTEAEAPIPGIRKAAMALVLLGDQSSAALIRELSEIEVHAVAREVARLDSVSADQAESLLAELYQMTVARDSFRRGGLEYARKMLVSAFGAAPASPWAIR